MIAQPATSPAYPHRPRETPQHRIECWKAIDGFEGFYEVSDRGRVRRLARRIAHPAGGTRAWPGRILKLVKAGPGYLQVGLYRDGRGCRRPVHRLVGTAFVQRRPGCAEINHLDGVKTNNTASNLEWTTTSGNALHAFRIGLNRPRQGESHGRSILNDAKVREIRRAHERGESRRSLSMRYGVHKTTVDRIVTRRSWSHVR